MYVFGKASTQLISSLVDIAIISRVLSSTRRSL